MLFAGIALLSWRKLRTWYVPELVVGLSVTLLYLTWILWEARVSLRDAKADSIQTDRWTAEAYAVAQGTTALSALWFESHWPTLPLAFVLGGALTFGGGVVLRHCAVRTLGAFYSHRVRVTDGHRIVQTGPYARLRHPAYAGMLLAHLGFVFCFFNWISILMLFAGLLPAIVIRIRVEESALANTPGYPEFCRSRARLVPAIW